MFGKAMASVALASVLTMTASISQAQTFTTLFNFDGTHGGKPNGSLTLSPDGSTIYGMTEAGGTNGDGTVFSIPVGGGTPTTLFSFDGIHGAYPLGSLTLSGSTLYGMTEEGGTNTIGTVFSIPVGGGTPTVLCSFDGTDGGQPQQGSLTLSGSTLYGMTLAGGTNGDGNVFSIPVGGGTATTLFSFDGTHGAGPFGSLTLSGSTLYGMTLAGGTNGWGTVFRDPRQNSWVKSGLVGGVEVRFLRHSRANE